MAKIVHICAILQLSLIPQIPHLEYRGIALSIFNTAPRGIALSIFNTAPRGIAVFAQPYPWEIINLAFFSSVLQI